MVITPQKKKPTNAVALKVYDAKSAYARFRLLWDNHYWKDWIITN